MKSCCKKCIAVLQGLAVNATSLGALQSCCTEVLPLSSALTCLTAWCDTYSTYIA